MATPARDANGHFLKRDSLQPKQLADGVTGDAGSGAQQNVGSGERIVDPSQLDAQRDAQRAAPESDTGKRGRGRPAGSKGKGKEGQSQEKLAVDGGKLDLDSLNFTLFFAHELLAKASKTPEIALTETEAKTMATCAHNVMKHYNITASQKAIDWGNLVLTGVIVYGGKFHAINERQARERAEVKKERAEASAPFNLTPIHG